MPKIHIYIEDEDTEDSLGGGVIEIDTFEEYDEAVSNILDHLNANYTFEED